MPDSKGPTMIAWERQDRARHAIDGGERMERVVAILDRVVIAPQEAPKMTPGGIHIPDEHRYETGRGVVLAKGPGSSEKGGGGPRAMEEIEVGDVVLFGRRAGVPVNYANGERALIMRIWDLIAVIEHGPTPCAECGRLDPGTIHPGSVALFD